MELWAEPQRLIKKKGLGLTSHNSQLGDQRNTVEIEDCDISLFIQSLRDRKRVDNSYAARESGEGGKGYAESREMLYFYHHSLQSRRVVFNGGWVANKSNVCSLYL